MGHEVSSISEDFFFELLDVVKNLADSHEVLHVVINASTDDDWTTLWCLKDWIIGCRPPYRVRREYPEITQNAINIDIDPYYTESNAPGFNSCFCDLAWYQQDDEYRHSFFISYPELLAMVDMTQFSVDTSGFEEMWK